MKEPNMFHNYETEKITRKASDMAENRSAIITRCSVLLPEIVMQTHLVLFSERNVHRYMRRA